MSCGYACVRCGKCTGKARPLMKQGKVSYVRTYQRQQSGNRALHAWKPLPRPTWNERKEITLEGQWSVEQNPLFPHSTPPHKTHGTPNIAR